MFPIRFSAVSPEGPVAEAMVSSVTLPGSLSPFQVLKDHAPIVTSLEEGDIVYVAEDGEHSVHIVSGFAEVRDNIVEACVEI